MRIRSWLGKTFLKNKKQLIFVSVDDRGDQDVISKTYFESSVTPTILRIIQTSFEPQKEQCVVFDLLVTVPTPEYCIREWRVVLINLLIQRPWSSVYRSWHTDLHF